MQKFLDIVRKYVHVEKLTPEVLRTFISKIVVHEREKKHSQTSPQQIDIYFLSATSELSLCRTQPTQQKKPNKTKGGQPKLSACA